MSFAFASNGAGTGASIPSIPGDPVVLVQNARVLEAVASNIRDGGHQVARIGLALSTTWKGQGYSSFSVWISTLERAHNLASSALFDLASALLTYASVLADCQAEVKAAQDQLAEAQASAATALSRLSSVPLSPHATAAALAQRRYAENAIEDQLQLEVRAALAKGQAAWDRYDAAALRAAAGIAAASAIWPEVNKLVGALGGDDASRLAATGLHLPSAFADGLFNFGPATGALVPYLDEALGIDGASGEPAPSGQPKRGDRAGGREQAGQVVLTAARAAGPLRRATRYIKGENGAQVVSDPFRTRGRMSDDCILNKICQTSRGEPRAEQTAQAYVIGFLDFQAVLGVPEDVGGQVEHVDPSGESGLISNSVQWEVRRLTGPKTKGVPVPGHPGKYEPGTSSSSRADVTVTVDVPTGQLTPSGGHGYRVVPEVYEVKKFTGPASVTAAQRQAINTARTLSASTNVHNFVPGTFLPADWHVPYKFDGQWYEAYVPRLESGAVAEGVVMFKPLDDDGPSQPPPVDPWIPRKKKRGRKKKRQTSTDTEVGGTGPVVGPGTPPKPRPRPPVGVPALAPWLIEAPAPTETLTTREAGQPTTDAGAGAG